MPSIIQTDTLKNASASKTLVEYSSSAWSWGTPPAGTVLQVLHFQDTETNGLDASFTNLYEKSITLKSASSDVYITFQVNYQLTSGQGFGFRIYRNNSATVTTSHTAVWTINPEDGTGTYSVYNGSSSQVNDNFIANAKDTLSGFSVGDTLYYGLFFRIYINSGNPMQIPTNSSAGGNGAFVMRLMEVQK